MNPETDAPNDFHYGNVIEKGMPRHEAPDDFLIRHPRMSVEKRAKLFAPFDALKGFSEALLSKEAIYEPKHELSAETAEALNRQIALLSKRLRDKNPSGNAALHATVTYFIPCEDIDSAAYGLGGHYRTVTGIVEKVDTGNQKCLWLDGLCISFEDMLEIRTDTCSG